MANVITIWDSFTITDLGLRLRQQSIATGAKITFCYAKIGQGVPAKPENIPNMTDIIVVAEEVPVVRVEAEGVTHYIGVRIDNKDFQQPILMTEIGLFATIGDDEPILYGYTYAKQGYDSIPAGAVSHYIWTVGIDTVISRTQSISFNYDGSKVYATEEEIDELIQAFDKLKDDVRSFEKTTSESIYNSVEISSNPTPAVGVRTHYYIVKTIPVYNPSYPILGVEDGMLQTDSGTVEGYLQSDEGVLPMAVLTE